MKKTLIALICALLLLPAATCVAESNPFVGSDTAKPDVANAIEIEIDGRHTSLGFDGSEEYSIAAGGTVQASFYAYSENAAYLYELYMIFPDTVQSGSTVTLESSVAENPDCCVTLIVSTNEEQQYFFAGLRDGAPFPSATAYTITFDSVSAEGDSRTYAGHITASLNDIAQDVKDPLVSFSIQEAPFSFTIPVKRGAEEANPFVDTPSASPETTPNVPLEPTPSPTPEATPQVYRV